MNIAQESCIIHQQMWYLIHIIHLNVARIEDVHTSEHRTIQAVATIADTVMNMVMSVHVLYSVLLTQVHFGTFVAIQVIPQLQRLQRL